MTQLETLNQKFKKLLHGRKINDGRIIKKKLTEDEIFLIEKLLRQIKDKPIPIIQYISKRHHLDFIGWNDEMYNDVLICTNN